MQIQTDLYSTLYHVQAGGLQILHCVLPSYAGLAFAHRSILYDYGSINSTLYIVFPSHELNLGVTLYCACS